MMKSHEARTNCSKFEEFFDTGLEDCASCKDACQLGRIRNREDSLCIKYCPDYYEFLYSTSAPGTSTTSYSVHTALHNDVFLRTTQSPGPQSDGLTPIHILGITLAVCIVLLILIVVSLVVVFKTKRVLTAFRNRNREAANDPPQLDIELGAGLGAGDVSDDIDAGDEPETTVMLLATDDASASSEFTRNGAPICQPINS